MRGVNAAVLVLGYGVWGLGSGVWESFTWRSLRLPVVAGRFQR